MKKKDIKFDRTNCLLKDEYYLIGLFTNCTTSATEPYLRQERNTHMRKKKNQL